ncbi:hypothetical protein [Microcoleus sp. D3_18a_C4]|uniref:hypothetical protein n=1 Tax=Microcoleus sp. D3_18a_C4 TaxID=3055332 RepID=UPI002FD1249E
MSITPVYLSIKSLDFPGGAGLTSLDAIAPIAVMIHKEPSVLFTLTSVKVTREEIQDV